MFTTKQSDIFYNDQTKEMFVCKVSSISAKRCEGSEDIVYGALPIVYKINKNSNYQSLIYPKNLSTFTTDTTSDLYDLVPSNCYADGTNFAHVTKPLINYNKSSDRYSITFVGKYTATADGFGVINHIFQYVDTDFHLLDSQIYVPKAKSTKTPPFTFSNGYLNSDLIIGGNKLRWNETAKPTEKAYSERVTDYNIKPTHIDHNNSLGFNLINYCPSFETDCLIGKNQYPFLWSGGYITYNPKYTAFDPAHDIRVDFRARSFNVPSMTAYRSIQSSNDDANPSRWIDIATTTDDVGGLSGAGSGFCVYFYENPYKGITEPQGIGSTLGYVKADSVVSEINGETTPVDGLIINENPYDENLGPPSNSFLGIGFDIRGEYCTTLEGKEGWLSGGGDAGYWSHGDSGSFTNTTAPCSVGIRGNRSSFTRVLTCQSMSTVAASAVPMHENASNSDGSDVSFQDYRIDLTNKGTRVTVYNKLTSATDYNTILQFDLDSVKDDSGKPYSPWKGFYNQEAYTVYDIFYDENNQPYEVPRQSFNTLNDQLNYPDGRTPAQGLNIGLNVGLSFTSSNYCSYFELSSFEVTGVKIGKPNKLSKEIDNTTTVEYLEESSANLRRDLVTIPTKDPVDITMLITRKSLIDRINLCGNILPPVEREIEATWTGVKEEVIDIPGAPKDTEPDDDDVPPECQPGWYDSWPNSGPGGDDAGDWSPKPAGNIQLAKTDDGVTYYTGGGDVLDYFELSNSAGDRYLLGVIKTKPNLVISGNPMGVSLFTTAVGNMQYERGMMMPSNPNERQQKGYDDFYALEAHKDYVKGGSNDDPYPDLDADSPWTTEVASGSDIAATIPEEKHLMGVHIYSHTDLGVVGMSPKPRQQYTIGGPNLKTTVTYLVLYKWRDCGQPSDFSTPEPEPEGSCVRMTTQELFVHYTKDLDGVQLYWRADIPVGPQQSYTEGTKIQPEKVTVQTAADYFIKFVDSKDGCVYVSVMEYTESDPDLEYEQGGNEDPIWGERISDTKKRIKELMGDVVDIRGL